MNGVMEYTENAERRRVILVGYLFPVALSVGALHMLALERYWYWLYPWMDAVVHYLGGFFVALCVLWVVFLSGFQKSFFENTSRVFFAALLAGLLVGISWEVFEFTTGMFTLRNWYPDTPLDIVFDSLGAITAALLFSASR